LTNLIALDIGVQNDYIEATTKVISCFSNLEVLSIFASHLRPLSGLQKVKLNPILASYSKKIRTQPFEKLRAVRMWEKGARANERSLQDVFPTEKIVWVNTGDDYHARDPAPHLAELVCCPCMHSTKGAEKKRKKEEISTMGKQQQMTRLICSLYV